jgi:hypothetical protein
MNLSRLLTRVVLLRRMSLEPQGQENNSVEEHSDKHYKVGPVR